LNNRRDRDKIYAPKIYINEYSLSWLGIYTSIKNEYSLSWLGTYTSIKKKWQVMLVLGAKIYPVSKL
jgi:hypothetical protein